jgi:uncharacterized ferredoxin-like protein
LVFFSTHKPFRIANLSVKIRAFVSFSETVVLDGRLPYQVYIAACKGAAISIQDRKEL